MDILSSASNPTGRISLTMVSCPGVIAVTGTEITIVIRDICAIPYVAGREASLINENS